MSERKIYTSFISSAFESLREERNSVIKTLLNFRVLPIGMEHFTVSTNGEFSDIEDLIDQSDFFILLLGESYGSTDKNGISWTEREYLYALEKKKPILAILCEAVATKLNENRENLSEDEKKQLDFIDSITASGYARKSSAEFSIETIINQFLGNYNFSKCIGWTRLEDITKNEEALARWREEHKAFDLRGRWYHAHLSDLDESYIRIGTVQIQQNFLPEKYLNLHLEGKNYSLESYDPHQERFEEDEDEYTSFHGEYTIKKNGEILGIFEAKRAFSNKFGKHKIAEGAQRGIHDFSFTVGEGETTRLNGSFHNEAPSVKYGKIHLFRTEKARNNFLLKKRGDIIRQLEED